MGNSTSGDSANVRYIECVQESDSAAPAPPPAGEVRRPAKQSTPSSVPVNGSQSQSPKATRKSVCFLIHSLKSFCLFVLQMKLQVHSFGKIFVYVTV